MPERNNMVGLTPEREAPGVPWVTPRERLRPTNGLPLNSRGPAWAVGAEADPGTRARLSSQAGNAQVTRVWACRRRPEILSHH